ncbi:QacE family quaternary ammonium compound efflux SMR transporter [Coxiella burnetii]|uniref:Quaternary ammonium compound-resistance protein n=1 Tax=Coxiella burnetii (strain Dugway 5J108-111) TaxID=434922 RepID=A9KDX0_COXBN|nr:multidrug efflux SMR transporter [Coxiella burnetii]ABS77072.1 quaternary ammonium compound-resistance protein [Coxiella burnetii Dugway 5J108-111]OYK80464.1 QacE family quaternary ammonium compound efflux SMR transporter [Coxiella burnetii]OYK82422.1 QacE family quaternary ammonium compound efflux SMR transporter [Coxiella burnetii]
MKWLYLLIAIVAEVIGTSALKASDGFTKFGASTLVIIGYGIAFYFLSLTLKSIPVGLAYAIWAGLGIVLISIIGWVVFHQHLDIAAIVGLVLIISGVLVINLLSKSIH